MSTKIKLIISTLILMVNVNIVGADIFKFVPLDNVEHLKRFEFNTGLASYTESSSFRNRIDTTIVPFIQTPLCSIMDSLDINIGVYIPLSHADRTRPLFSVSYQFPSDWVIREVGAYLGASPWEPWGFQVSFFRIEL